MYYQIFYSRPTFIMLRKFLEYFYHLLIKFLEYLYLSQSFQFLGRPGGIGGDIISHNIGHIN